MLSLTKKVLKSRFVFIGVVYHFPILLSFPEEVVEAVGWDHGNVEMWAKCARCARCHAYFWGGFYGCAISPNISERTKSIRGACTKAGQHQAACADEPNMRAGQERVDGITRYLPVLYLPRMSFLSKPLHSIDLFIIIGNRHFYNETKTAKTWFVTTRCVGRSLAGGLVYDSENRSREGTREGMQIVSLGDVN